MGYLEGIDKEDDNGNIIEKVDTTEIIKKINEYSDAKKPIFLFIFMDGCGHCVTAKKEWVQIPGLLNNNSDDFLIAAIEQEHFDALHDVGVKPMGYPSFRYIEGAAIEDYEGGRTGNDFVTWIQSKQGSTQEGGVSFLKSVLRKYKKRRTVRTKRKTVKRSKRNKRRKTMKRSKRRKTTRTKKTGGFLFTQEVGINGVNASKTTGKRRYNWTTGKWDYEDCYGIGPLKTCKIRAA